MGPSDGGVPGRPGRPYLPPPDISVAAPRGTYPLSRGARERRLERLDHFDRRAELVAAETLTSTGTVRLSFRVLGSEPFVFRPGYFIGIQADCPGHGSRRSPYCIVSPPRSEPTFELLVRLVPEGPLSCYLSALRVGDVIDFRGPAGRSLIPRDGGARQLVFIATGVGIGPLLSYAHHLAAEGSRVPIRLYWGLRLAEDICLLDDLDELALVHPDFAYQISLSRPPSGWQGPVGRVTETVPPQLEALGDRRFYLVGNGAMIEEFHAALSDLGVDKRRIHTETYFNSRHRPTPEAVAAVRDRFVAADLFSPAAHQQAGGFIPRRPAGRGAAR